MPTEDLEVERIGFGPDSVYFEYCLPPLIGPRCCVLHRHVAPMIRRSDRVAADLSDLGRNIGLGAPVGPNSAVVKALGRLEVFRLGGGLSGDHYPLRRVVAPLGDRQAQRLPAREEHPYGK